MIVHQTIFASIQTLQDHLFDCSMKLCADREWLIYCYYHYKIKYMNLDICYYDVYGESSNQTLENRKKLRKETDICLKRYMPFLARLLYPIKIVKRFIAP